MSQRFSKIYESQETSDAVLMERLATRDDTAAFDTLFLRHQRAVYHFAVRLLGMSQAEDVTQETFLRLWRARGVYRPQNNASLRTYLLTITRRLILDIAKRPHVEPESPSLPKNTPEGVVLTREFEQVVEQGLVTCLLYTSPSPRDRQKSRMPSSA